MKTIATEAPSGAALAADSVIGLDAAMSSEGKTRAALHIGKANMFAPEQNRYTFKHMEEFFPTKTIDAGEGLEFIFMDAGIPFDQEKIGFSFRDPLTGDVSTSTLAQMLRETRADALVVLKDGRLVHEAYFDGQTPRTRHQMMSVTKSLTGMLAGALLAEGKLDRNARVGDLIPELLGSAYGDATVGQVMDMTVGIRYCEDYTDPESEVAIYGAVLGFFPSPTGYSGPRTIREFLPTLRKKCEHGRAFHYVTANTDVLGWLCERATGIPLEKMIEEHIWSKMGMARDAYVLVDSAGTASCGAGFNATAVDLAKIGQMLLDEGLFNGQRILPPGFFAELLKGGDRETFARSPEGKIAMSGWSYRDQFWFRHNAHNAYMAIGIFGQWLYIDPAARTVIVMQSSLPLPDSDEVVAYTLAAFDAIIAGLD
ncbi:6-aminohexanoate-dimer hydrolase [Brucella endophytica]|uniref:6-aminohexanoate-dimer hydrolase n=1 Tax=Brucella endophytica TaxID=1963359 RepID=A0A916SMZ0_9HYPH|nr:serine hydrolase [Brucella endophytica]GGB08874.1 6-aminohexanoate-dimer hydrolase [Brucella endophytica]